MHKETVLDNLCTDRKVKSEEEDAEKEIEQQRDRVIASKADKH